MEKNNKRKGDDSSGQDENQRKQTKIDDYWLAMVPTHNPFAPLATGNADQPEKEKENEDQEKETEKREPRPPPIFVHNVQDIKPLTELLETVVKDAYTYKTLRDLTVKIQPSNGDTYRKLHKALKDKNTDMHSYQMKSDKGFRVVLKGLHHSTDPDDIKNALDALEHHVIRVNNKKCRKTKKPLPMFDIELSGVDALRCRVTSSHDLSSDHSPVILEIFSNAAIITKEPHLVNKHTDWTLFRDELDELITVPESLTTELEIDMAVDSLSHAIQSAARTATPLIQYQKKNVFHQPESIRKMIKQKRRLRQIWQSTRHPVDKTNFNKAAKELKEMLEKVRNESVAHYLQNLSPTESTDYSLFKATKKINQPKKTIPPIRKSDGTWARTDEEKASTFAQHLKEVFSPWSSENDVDDDIDDFLGAPGQLCPPIKRIRSSEIVDVICNDISAKKAPGMDQITGQVLKESSAKCVRFIQMIFNAILILGHGGGRSPSPRYFRRGGRTPPNGLGHHSTPDDLSPEERDARTVFCMQLSQRIRARDLEEFFSSVGKVRDVRLITCNKTKRFKGIAYIEFKDPESVPLALGLSGQKLLGIPISVQHTQAEKNRLANAPPPLPPKNHTGPMRLYVGSLHFNITEDMLRGIFEPFGKIDSIQLIMDTETGRSKGYGFITFHNAEDAKKALEQLNGFELAGRPMKVGNVTERLDVNTTTSLDTDEMDRSGIDLGATGRLQLMFKLAEGAGLAVPQAAANALLATAPQPAPIQPPTPTPPIATQCFMLSNMFDPATETNPTWEQEIQDDVIEEANKHGGCLHVFVDKISPQGNVYVKCPSIATAVLAVNSLHGRWFAGRAITAAYVPLLNYHTLFPDSVTASNLLIPSRKP
ncbi:RNA-binding protein 39 [Sergentomyia squamirostris]